MTIIGKHLILQVYMVWTLLTFVLGLSLNRTVWNFLLYVDTIDF